MAVVTVLDRSELDAELTLAPERYDPRNRLCAAQRLADVASFARETVASGVAGSFVAIDTTHAAAGFIALAPLQKTDEVRSAKRRVRPGDVIVSRLRPYLRQIAYVDDGLQAAFPAALLCCSTEFYVLRPAGNAPIAFLLPFLLSDPVQAYLRRAQEGGHHPRVPREALAMLPLPRTAELLRNETVIEAIAGYRRAEERLHREIAFHVELGARIDAPIGEPFDVERAR